MKPIDKFKMKPKSFWASVRSISQQFGYTQRGKGLVSFPTIQEMEKAFRDLELDPTVLVRNGVPTPLAEGLHDYLKTRADYLNEYVEPKLMDAAEAEALFNKTKAELKPKCPLPMNKQKGDKKKIAYLTSLVNIMVEKYADGMECDYDPLELATITKDGIPVRTLSRRLDGAFPSAVNPVALWEIKEYYYTTTFGSRVSGGVYETLLDGMELEELHQNEGIDVKHYLIVDAHATWWGKGRPYLCRMFDALHMGLADEILFGREVVEEMPRLVAEWVEIARARERLI